MRETKLSRDIVKAIERAVGGRCKILRINAGGYRGRMQGAPKGTPDRLVLLPHGVTLWMEVKRPGEKPTDVQETWHAAVRGMGHKVAVVTSQQEAVTAVREAMRMKEVENG